MRNLGGRRVGGESHSWTRGSNSRSFWVTPLPHDDRRLRGRRHHKLQWALPPASGAVEGGRALTSSMFAGVGGLVSNVVLMWYHRALAGGVGQNMCPCFPSLPCRHSHVSPRQLRLFVHDERAEVYLSLSSLPPTAACSAHAAVCGCSVTAGEAEARRLPRNAPHTVRLWVWPHGQMLSGLRAPMLAPLPIVLAGRGCAMKTNFCAALWLVARSSVSSLRCASR